MKESHLLAMFASAALACTGCNTGKKPENNSIEIYSLENDMSERNNLSNNT